MDLGYRIYEDLNNNDAVVRAETWKQYAKLLLRIQNKRGSRLTIRFEQKHSRLNLWPEAFKASREVVDVFGREGAQIQVTFRYDNMRLIDPIEYDVLYALKNPDSNWRQEAEAFFDSVCATCSRPLE